MAKLTSKGPQILYQHGALGTGSDVWIIPSQGISAWHEKLDWYLNFQISRAEKHKPLEISKELRRMIDDYELNISPDSPKLNSEMLMIACESRLPTKMLIRISANDNFTEWVLEIHKLWLSIAQPKLRIFLPVNFPVSQFSRLWPKESHGADLTLVPSQPPQPN